MKALISLQDVEFHRFKQKTIKSCYQVLIMFLLRIAYWYLLSLNWDLYLFVSQKTKTIFGYIWRYIFIFFWELGVLGKYSENENDVCLCFGRRQFLLKRLNHAQKVVEV